MIKYFVLLFLSSLTAFSQLPWTNHVLYADIEMPTGIPMPSFGATNTHWVYHPDLNPSATYDYGDGPVPYRTNIYGPFAYYIDNTAVGAMDGTNTYGTPAVPRLTAPWPVVAGSVVMFANGGTYSFNNGASSTMRFGGHGTEALPIFYVAVGSTTNVADRPKLNRSAGVNQHGEWMCIDHFVLTNNTIFSARMDIYNAPITNVAFRNNLGVGTGASSTTVAFAWGGGSAPNYAANNVILSNIITRYGNYTNATENDACMTILGQYTTNNWVIYNTAWQLGGDMIRIGANEDNDLDNCLNAFNYVGRNTSWQNGENAVDVKKAHKSVVSENHFYDLPGYVATAGDAAIVVHYNPNYTWFINNRIYTGVHGINTGSRMQATNSMYHIGNLVYDFTDSAYYWRGTFTNYMMNNTFTLAPQGVRVSTSGGPVHVRMTNNIIYEVGAAVLDFQNSSTRAQSQIGYDNYYDATSFDIEWGVNYNSVAAFEAAVATVGDLTQLDPDFVSVGTSDYTLSASSPLRDTGTDTISFMEDRFLEQFGFALSYKDGNGRTVIGAPYVGAFEAESEPETGSYIITGSGTISGSGTITGQ